MNPLSLTPSHLLGNTLLLPEPPLFSDAVTYRGHAVGDGLEYRFPAGSFVGLRWLTADMLLHGNVLSVFEIHLQEGEHGPCFSLSFGLINQCQARIRVDLRAVKQNRWRYPREGAWLKPACGGYVVDLKKIDRMRLTLFRIVDQPVTWCMTPFQVTSKKPPALKNPLTPTLLDELGQSTIHKWPTRSRSRAEVTDLLKEQLESVGDSVWPDSFSKWGGWKAKRLKSSGFFRTEKTGERWWLVDPDGFVFWSTGLDCVDFNVETIGIENALAWVPDKRGPFASVHGTREGQPSINYLAANFIHAFGPEKAKDAWNRITLSQMRAWGFNTVANWSDWKMARVAGFPYVRPLDTRLPQTPLIFRDFPDVYDPAFPGDCAGFAEQLTETRGDPAMIGYFLMNEPTWGFAAHTPAEGIWNNSRDSATGLAFKEFLKERGSAAPTERDFVDFSAIISEKLFKGLSDACRAVDPDHLNLGGRYYTTPPEWALQAMKQFDVFSMNCYERQVWPDKVADIATRLAMPVLVGEWHFGALDSGLPASGLGHVRDQQARGQVYRHYLENAAALPACVGVHYFTLYDNSALGRFDGEVYNIGFLDTCNRPYQPLVEAARLSHERMYAVANRDTPAFDEAPGHLPLLFM